MCRLAVRNEPQQIQLDAVGVRSSPPTYKNKPDTKLEVVTFSKTGWLSLLAIFFEIDLHSTDT